MEYKPNSDKLEGSACIFSEKIGIKCPRNCKGPDPSLNTSYTEWDETNWNKTCPDPSNNILSESDYKITRTRTRIYNSEIKELNGGKCLDTPADVKYTKEEVQIDCSRNCIGGNWGDWFGCSAKLCEDGDKEIEEVKTGKQTRIWKGGTEAINGGKTCSEMHPPDQEDCSRKCNIDCKGSWSPCSVPCGGVGEQTFIGTEKKNSGQDCKDNNVIRKIGDKFSCEIPCPIDCQVSWSECYCDNGVSYQSSTVTAGNTLGNNNCGLSNVRRQCELNTACVQAPPPPPPEASEPPEPPEPPEYDADQQNGPDCTCTFMFFGHMMPNCDCPGCPCPDNSGSS